VITLDSRFSFGVVHTKNMRDILLVIIQQLILLKGDDYLFGETPLFRILNPFQAYILFLVITGLIWMFAAPKIFKGRVFNANGRIILPFTLLMVVELISCYFPYANSSYHQGRWLFYPEYQFCMFFMAFFIAESNISRVIWKRGMILGYLVFVCTIFIDVFHPMTFSILNYRAAGLGLNPNITAEIIAMYLIMILNWSKPLVADAVMLFIGFLAEFATLSREGIVVYLVVLIMYFYSNRKNYRLLLRFLGTVFVLGFVCIGTIPLTLGHLPMFSIHSDRLAAFLGHNPGSLLTDGNGRVTYAVQAFDTALDKPIFGYGEGYVSTMINEPHNEYLAIWLEQGILGVCLYLWWLWAVLRKGFVEGNHTGVAMTFSIILYGLFNHNILNDKSMVEMVVLATIFPLLKEYQGLHGTGRAQNFDESG
jgi:O-antigen ligase